MYKTKKRVWLITVLACLFAFVFSLGVLCACGSTDSGSTSDATWYYGASAPAEDLGNVGDYYLDTESLASYVKTETEWQPVSADQAGSWFHGTEAPQDSLGDVNDFYLDTKTGKLYHKSEGGWGSPILVLQGQKGRDGVVWHSGNKAPDEYPEGDEKFKDAKAGDFYLDYSKFEVYQLGEDKTWNKLGSLKGQDGVTPELPEPEKVTVTFDANGGADLGDDGVVEVAKGDSLEAIPVPTRTNYTFLGWFTGTGVNDGQVTTLTPITRNITLYAHWVFSGKYTFDSFTVDGIAVNVRDGASIRVETTHEFGFIGHGKDDSFLQIWYSKEGVEGSALWNRPLGGKTYMQGYQSDVMRGPAGEVSIAVGNASFIEAGIYSIYMEIDGNLSPAYKLEVKDKISVSATPEENKIELLEGAIESPETAAVFTYGETKEYTFVLEHSVLTANSKPRVILGASGAVGTGYASWDETRNDYEMTGNGYDMFVDESFYYCTLDEYLAKKGATPYGEFSIPKSLSGNRYYNYNTYVRDGAGLPYGKVNSIWVQNGPEAKNTESKSNVIIAYYDGVEYWYDEAQQKFVTVNGWPQQVLPVEDGKLLSVKPYLYTYTYGAELQPRGFTGVYKEEDSKVVTYPESSDSFTGTIRVSKFEVHDGYVEITLQMMANAPTRSNDPITYKPTLIYEYTAEDGSVTRFDLIGNKKIEEDTGYEKTRLNVQFKSASAAAPANPLAVEPSTKRLTANYLNGVAPNDIKLTWTGEADDFEPIGVYVHDMQLAQNEVYEDDEFALAYRYDGVTEEDGKQKAVFNFYYYVAHKSMVLSSGQDYILRIDYRYKGVEYSQYITLYSHGNDLNDVAKIGRAMLEGWHAMLEAYKGANDPSGYLARVHEIIDPLYENKEFISAEVYNEVFMAGKSGSKVPEMNLAAILEEKKTPFETTSAEQFNAVAAEMTEGLLAKYNGVSRATLVQWYRKNFYQKTTYIYDGNFWNRRSYGYFYSLFYGANSTGYLNDKVWEYASDNVFGSVEIFAGFVKEIFNLCAPAEISKLLDEVWATHTAPADDIDTAAVAAFGEAYEAYHANPSDDTLQAYIIAANNYSAAVDRSDKALVGHNCNALNQLNYLLNDYNKDLKPNDDPATKKLYDAVQSANTAANTAKMKLSADTIGDYAKAVEAYAAAMEAYSIARNKYDVIGNLKSTWEELDAKKSANTLTEVQSVLYDAYQTIRTEGLADGAQPDKVLLLREKTGIILGAAINNPESYDVHMDIYTWLNNRTTFSMAKWRELSPLFLAYDGDSNRYDLSNHFHDNLFTVKQFAHVYKVLYTDGAVRGSEEYMTLLKEYLETAHKSVSVGEDATKKGITAALSLYLNLPVRAKLEKAYQDNPSDVAAKNAYLDYVDGILAVDCYFALSNRFNNNASGYMRSDVTGVELSAFLDKLVEYLDGTENNASFVTEFITARKNDHSAATNYAEFMEKYPQYQGWNPSTVVNFHINYLVDQSLLNMQDGDGKYVFTTDGLELKEDNSNLKQFDAGLKAIYDQFVATKGKDDKNHRILAENLYKALNSYLYYTSRNSSYWEYAPDGVKD